jgi:hypothetical protein
MQFFSMWLTSRPHMLSWVTVVRYSRLSLRGCMSGFATVLCCTWQSEPVDTTDGASGIFTPAQASLPLPEIIPGLLSPKADTLPLHHYTIQFCHAGIKWAMMFLIEDGCRLLSVSPSVSSQAIGQHVKKLMPNGFRLLLPPLLPPPPPKRPPTASVMPPTVLPRLLKIRLARLLMTSGTACFALLIIARMLSPPSPPPSTLKLTPRRKGRRNWFRDVKFITLLVEGIKLKLMYIKNK